MIDTYKTIVISYSSRADIILSVILSVCLLALNTFIRSPTTSDRTMVVILYDSGVCCRSNLANSVSIVESHKTNLCVNDASTKSMSMRKDLSVSIATL